MIDLEKHIKEQRLLIDSDSPREGHEERFLQKLGRDIDSVPVRKFNFRAWTANRSINRHYPYFGHRADETEQKRREDGRA